MGRGPGGPESPEQGTADGAVSGGVRRCDRAQDACPTLYYMCATAVRSLSGGERACWGPPQHAHKSLEKKEQGLGPPKIYRRFDRNPRTSLKTLGNRRTRLYFDQVPRYSKKVYVLDTKP